MMKSIKISAVLLAAGLSKRMGEDKLMLNYCGHSILQQAIDLLSELPVYERILVTNETRLKSLSLQADIMALINPKPESGQSGSVKIGMEVATGTNFLFIPADQPKLRSIDIIPLINAAEEYPDKIIFPIVNTKPSSPTIFPERFREELLNLTGDDGGRNIRNSYPDLCHMIETEYPENFLDIDSVEDYRSLCEVGEESKPPSL